MQQCFIEIATSPIEVIGKIKSKGEKIDELNAPKLVL